LRIADCGLIADFTASILNKSAIRNPQSAIRGSPRCHFAN
jgi:hypothetical protein